MFDITFFNVPDGHRLGMWNAQAAEEYSRLHGNPAPFAWGDILMLLPDGSLQAIGNIDGVMLPIVPDMVLRRITWLVE